MSRLHAFLQKRQPLLPFLLVILSCALAGCAPDQRVELQRRAAPACDQRCDMRLDEGTFICIDRCHIESDRTYVP